MKAAEGRHNNYIVPIDNAISLVALSTQAELWIPLRDLGFNGFKQLLGSP